MGGGGRRAGQTGVMVRGWPVYGCRCAACRWTRALSCCYSLATLSGTLYGAPQRATLTCQLQLERTSASRRKYFYRPNIASLAPATLARPGGTRPCQCCCSVFALTLRRTDGEGRCPVQVPLASVLSGASRQTLEGLQLPDKRDVWLSIFTYLFLT